MKVRLISLLLATLLGATVPAAAEPARVARSATVSPTNALGLAEQITLAGQLRMQSQRLAKLWLQGGLGIEAGTANARLARGVVQFDTALAVLQKAGGDAPTLRSLQRTAALWEEYRQTLAMPYGPGALVRIGYLAEELTLATGRLAMQIEGSGDSATGRLLDLSLRQNMLVQRLARLYLMAYAGDRSSGRLVDIGQTRREFSTALEELSAARENTPASREALVLARTQWMFFATALDELSRGNEGRPQHVATTSERLLEVLDAVSSQYAQDYGASLLAAAPSITRRN